MTPLEEYLAKITEANLDIATLSNFVNDETATDLTSRLGTTYPNLIKLIEGIQAKDTQAIAIVAAMQARINAVDDSSLINQLIDADYSKPITRLSKNQLLHGTSAAPDGWLANTSGTTYTKVFTVASTPWNNRSAEEQELLTAMGRAGAYHIYHAFDVWRIDWTSNSPTYTIYQKISASAAITVGSWCKLISGSVSSSWADGATAAWGVCGTTHGESNLGYANIHPNKISTTGSLLFCLPAAVMGKVPLDQGHWGIFPYIGDDLND